jgi:hypothetical protein
MNLKNGYFSGQGTAGGMITYPAASFNAQDLLGRSDVSLSELESPDRSNEPTSLPQKIPPYRIVAGFTFDWN